MPLYSLDIEKELYGEYWTNRYILQTASMSDAITPANAIVQMELNCLLGNVNVTRYRISDSDPATDTYIIIPVGEIGVRPGVTSNGMPLFTVVRVDFPAPVGRPSRKYLRGVLAEQDQVSYGILDSPIITYVNDNYATLLGALEAFVDVDGQPLGAGQVWPRVAMRQLRRGSKRRTQPILP